METLAHTLAEAAGLTARELLAEAEQIEQVCYQQGIASWGDMVCFWAAELGMTPEELELEREIVRYRGVTP